MIPLFKINQPVSFAFFHLYVMNRYFMLLMMSFFAPIVSEEQCVYNINILLIGFRYIIYANDYHANDHFYIP